MIKIKIVMEDFTLLIEDGGVRKKVLNEGTGAIPQDGQLVSIMFIGKLENGQQFDYTEDPYEYILGKKKGFKGLDIAVRTMKEGEKSLFFIKSEYAYGKKGALNMVPADTNIFMEIELVEFQKLER